MNQSNRGGLGATYLTEFENIMSTLSESPHRHPIEMKTDIRRKSMAIFPFSILYRNILGSIQILAVAHHRRRPTYWLGRSLQQSTV